MAYKSLPGSLSRIVITHSLAYVVPSEPHITLGLNKLQSTVLKKLQTSSGIFPLITSVLAVMSKKSNLRLTRLVDNFYIYDYVCVCRGGGGSVNLTLPMCVTSRIHTHTHTHTYIHTYILWYHISVIKLNDSATYLKVLRSQYICFETWLEIPYPLTDVW